MNSKQLEILSKVRGISILEWLTPMQAIEAMDIHAKWFANWLVSGVDIEKLYERFLNDTK